MKSIEEYLDNVINETKKSVNTLKDRRQTRLAEQTRAERYHATLKEKEIQKRTAQNFVVKEDDEPILDTPKSETPSEKDNQALRDADVSVSDIVEKLNAIRAGKSFKDEAIHTELEKYFESLDKAERVALFAYLKGIQEIVSGLGDGEKAMEPSDSPADVEMEKKPSRREIHIKPNIIRKGGETKKSSPSLEDTTPPAPITPKNK